MDVHEAFLQELKNARLCYRRWLEPVCRAQALSRLEADILLFLYNDPGHDTAQSICELRGLAKSNVSHAVEALAARGLLDRRRDAGNRRVVRLALTPAGRAVAGTVAERQRAFFRLLTRGLEPREVEDMLRLMRRMEANVRAELEAAQP